MPSPGRRSRRRASESAGRVVPGRAWVAAPPLALLAFFARSGQTSSAFTVKGRRPDLSVPSVANGRGESVRQPATNLVAARGAWGCADLRAGVWFSYRIRPTGEDRPRVWRAADILDRLGRASRPPPRDPNEIEEKAASGAATGGVGGAVLGGLLLGPFGAIFGAQVGAEWGARRAANKAATEEFDLDKDMVELAQRVARELAEAMESRDRVTGIRDDLTLRTQQLEADAQRRYNEAAEAMSADNEALARKLLEDKLRLTTKAEKARRELEDAERRCVAMARNVATLETRALEVANLLERARGASGTRRTDLAAEASRLGMQAPRDPLLDRFEALERSDSK